MRPSRPAIASCRPTPACRDSADPGIEIGCCVLCSSGLDVIAPEDSFVSSRFGPMVRRRAPLTRALGFCATRRPPARRPGINMAEESGGIISAIMPAASIARVIAPRGVRSAALQATDGRAVQVLYRYDARLATLPPATAFAFLHAGGFLLLPRRLRVPRDVVTLACNAVADHGASSNDMIAMLLEAMMLAMPFFEC